MRIAVLLACWATAAAATPPLEAQAAAGAETGPRDGPIRLVDIAPDVGLTLTHENGASGAYYMPEIMGAGGAFVDYDSDGDLDVVLVGGGDLRSPAATRNYLLRHDRVGAESTLVDVTAAAGLASRGYGMGIGVGDIDGDGYPDLYFANAGGNQLLHNRGDGTFVDITEASGTDDPRWSVAVAFFDADGDGALDLFVGNYLDFTVRTHQTCTDRADRVDYCGPSAYPGLGNRLFRGDGRGGFDDVSRTSGVGAPARSTLGAVALDANRDGLLDLFVANDQMPNALWLNQGALRFLDDGLMSGTALSGSGQPEASMGVIADDLDGDGQLDLFLTHLRGETNTFLRGDGEGLYLDATDEFGLGAPSWGSTGFGTSAPDLDLDGRRDLFVANGAVVALPDLRSAADPFPFHEPNLVLRGTGEGFTEVEVPAADVARASRGTATGDFDLDGDDDLLVTHNAARPQLLRNDTQPKGPFIAALVERQPGVAALGARVETSTPSGGRVVATVGRDGSYASAKDPTVRFGGADEAATLDVVYAGNRHRFVGLETGRTYRVRLP